MVAERPRVSILMANYNGAPYVAQSLRSALAQTERDLEIVVCDDASTDDSLDIIRAVAATDGRVRVLVNRRNAGISRTRNRLLDEARGAWLAVQDSDDLLHPDRLRRLLAAAARTGADMVADDLLEFPGDGRGPFKLLVGRRHPFPIDAARLLRRAHVLGYLKPLWRAGAGGAVRYNPDMIVAEDFDFGCRMVVGGARYVFHPEALYFYRKHARSISAGSDRRKQDSILAGDAAFRRTVPLDGPLRRAADDRTRRIRRHMAYDETVEALRRRDWTAAARILAAHPSSAAVFRINVEARLRRAFGGRFRNGAAPGASPRPALLVLARDGERDRLADPSLGILLALARDAGLERRLLVLGSGRKPPADSRFDRVVACRSLPATDAGAGGDPGADALAVARETPGLRLAVALGPLGAALLPYRLDDAVPTLTLGTGPVPADRDAFRRLLERRPVDAVGAG